jgi:hypothetical protein
MQQAAASSSKAASEFQSLLNGISADYDNPLNANCFDNFWPSSCTIAPLNSTERFMLVFASNQNIRLSSRLRCCFPHALSTTCKKVRSPCCQGHVVMPQKHKDLKCMSGGRRCKVQMVGKVYHCPLSQTAFCDVSGVGNLNERGKGAPSCFRLLKPA